MTTKNNKLPPGRVRKSSTWSPKKKDYQYIEDAIGRGVTQGWLMNHYGITNNTWCKRKEEYPELVECIQRGKATDREEIQNKVRQIAMKDTHRSQLQALIFYGKTIVNMSDESPQTKEEVTVTLPKGVVFTSKSE